MMNSQNPEYGQITLRTVVNCLAEKLKIIRSLSNFYYSLPYNTDNTMQGYEVTWWMELHHFPILQ